MLKKFSQSDVKDQGHSKVKCTFTAERYPSTYARPSIVSVAESYIHFNDVALRLGCFMFSIFQCSQVTMLSFRFVFSRVRFFKCVRLSRLLAFECTLNHCTFIHSSKYLCKSSHSSQTLNVTTAHFCEYELRKLCKIKAEKAISYVSPSLVGYGEILMHSALQ